MNIETCKESIRAPQVVLGFSGWPDAGKLVEFTFLQLKTLVAHELAAEWDLDGFWHTEATRPQITVQHGQIRHIEWPSFQFFSTPNDASTPTLFWGSGPEPSLSWRLFAEELIALLKTWECREIILLGSLLDQVFHDEVLISGVVQDSDGYNRVRRLGCELIEYSGPSAIHSAIMAEAQKSDIRCMSFWAHLPFYLSGPHELIADEFLRILENLLGIELPPNDLAKAWKTKEKQIEQLVHQDQGLRQAIDAIKKEKVMRRSGLSSKVVRFEDFLKKRNDLDPDKE